jgi:hypothetical protein
MIDALYHGNCLPHFFGRHSDRLFRLLTDVDASTAVQNKLVLILLLNPETQPLVIISFPYWFKERLWKFIFHALQKHPKVCLVLIDHVEAFKIRKRALFKTEGLDKYLFFCNFSSSTMVACMSSWPCAMHDIYVDNTAGRISMSTVLSLAIMMLAA